MGIEVRIIRQENEKTVPYEDSFVYEGNLHITVEGLLIHINDRLLKANKRLISWDCSCEQGICGACAMVINGMPRLVCQTFCDEVVQNGLIKIMPLRKFKVVSDLRVDRAIMFDLLKEIQSHKVGDKYIYENTCLNESNTDAGKNNSYDLGYRAANCLMCGCCLDICPHFKVDKHFAGLMGAAAITKLSVNSANSEWKECYNHYVANDCSMILACDRVCPAGLEMGIFMEYMGINRDNRL